MPAGYLRYVEPFAGSACLFFAANPANAILGDVNAELTGMYEAVRKSPGWVHRALSRLPKGKVAYYRTRAQDPGELSATQRAARFIYLNRYCFNGIYRTNKNGDFNVPYGPERTGPLPSAEQLKRCAEKLRNASLVTGSFEKTLALVKAGDFVYLDPPYAVSRRRVFTEYSNHVFVDAQLSALRKELKRLDKLGASFLVSYAYSREGLDLGRGFNRKSQTVLRQVAGFTSHRKTARELLISNY